ncbi:unnamed protein product [Umbelopsis vinacea]
MYNITSDPIQTWKVKVQGIDDIVLKAQLEASLLFYGLSRTGTRGYCVYRDVVGQRQKMQVVVLSVVILITITIGNNHAPADMKRFTTTSTTSRTANSGNISTTSRTSTSYSIDNSKIGDIDNIDYKESGNIGNIDNFDNSKIGNNRQHRVHYAEGDTSEQTSD